MRSSGLEGFEGIRGGPIRHVSTVASFAATQHWLQILTCAYGQTSTTDTASPATTASKAATTPSTSSTTSHRGLGRLRIVDGYVSQALEDQSLPLFKGSQRFLLELAQLGCHCLLLLLFYDIVSLLVIVGCGIRLVHMDRRHDV